MSVYFEKQLLQSFRLQNGEKIVGISKTTTGYCLKPYIPKDILNFATIGS